MGVALDPVTITGAAGGGAVPAPSGGGGGGGGFSGLTDALGKYIEHRWAVSAADHQMDFQREMANTAHQREVADLKAAGLNPMLSVAHGGAPAPGGAMAANVGNPLSSGLNSAATWRRLEADLDNLRVTNTNIRQQTATGQAQESHLDAQAAEARSRELLNLSLIPKADADINSAVAMARKLNAEATLTELGKNAAQAASDMASGVVGKIAPYLGVVGGALGTAATVKKAFGTRRTTTTSELPSGGSFKTLKVTK